MDSLQFFELVHIADLVQQMLDVYYNEDIVSFTFFLNPFLNVLKYIRKLG